MIFEIELVKLRYQVKELELPIVKFKGEKIADRQVRILLLLAEGRLNYEIAHSLSLSKRTVEWHLRQLRQNLNSKLGYRLNERQLVLFAKALLEGLTSFQGHEPVKDLKHF